MEDITKILCQQVILQKFIEIKELKKIFEEFKKSSKKKNDFKEILNQVRQRLQAVGLNAKKINHHEKEFVVVTIPYNSKYIKINRLDEIGIALLANIVNIIEIRGGSISQTELKMTFKKHTSRINSFLNLNYINLIEIEGKFEKEYSVTPLGLSIILEAKEELNKILQETNV